MLRLHLKDIEEIYDLLSKHCKSVSLKDDEYEYDSPADLNKRYTQEIIHLEITSFLPTLSVTLRRRFSSLWVLEPEDMTSAGLWTQIDRILSRNISPLNKFTSPWIMVMLPVISIIPWLVLVELHKYSEYGIDLAPIAFLSSIVPWYQLYLRARRHTVIYLSTPVGVGRRLWSERANIVALLALIVAVVSVIFSVILSK